MSSSAAAAHPLDLTAVPLSNERLEIVLCVLSRTLGEVPTPPGDSPKIHRVLERYAGQVLEDGTPAFDEGFRTCRRPYEKEKILSMLGLSPPELSAMWSKAKRRDKRLAKLPAHVIDVAVCSDLWVVVDALIADGPELFEDRANEYLDSRAAEPAPNYTTRIEGSDARVSSMSIDVTTLRRLVRSINAVRPAFPDSLELRQWDPDYVPELGIPGGRRPAQTLDGRVPAWHLIRARHAEIHQEILTRLKCESGDELKAIAALPPSRITRGALFKLLRNWAFVTTLVCTASRLGALHRLNYEDLVYDAPIEDLKDRLVSGPAIKLRPRKGHGYDEISLKPLGEAGQPLIILWSFIARFIETVEPGAEIDPTWPLFPSSLSDARQTHITVRRWTRTAIRDWMRGTRKAYEQRPPGFVARPWDPGLGYTVHRYRSASFKALEGLAASRLIEAEGLDIPQRFFADVITDHRLDSDVRSIYLRATTNEGRTAITAAASRMLWLLLTTDAGARKVPDTAGYRQDLREERALKTRRNQLDEQMAAIAQLDAPTTRDLTQIITMSQEAIQIAEALKSLELDIERIETADATRYVSLPDDLIYEPDVNLEQIRLEVLGQINRTQRTVQPRLRDWWTVKEFALVIGRSQVHVNRWINGEGMATDPHMRPWNPNEIPVEHISSKKRRILIDGLLPEFVEGDPERQARLEEMLTRWPTGWSTKYQQPEAVPPGWMVSRRQDLTSADQHPSGNGSDA